MGKVNTMLILLVLGIVAFHRMYLVNQLDLQPYILTGKTAVVTGGTDGVGKEAAKILASWG